jgi:MATE family multidrug resistance protein
VSSILPPQDSRAGGYAEVFRLAVPLVISNSFWTIQLTLDRVMLSRQNSDAVGAALAAGVIFWTPLALFQQTASYATTFVAQYVGAGRPHRVGPSVWQALYFSLIAGIAFLGFLPFTDQLAALTGHPPHIQELESIYLRCLSFATLPILITATVSAFFAGRGDTWPVVAINAAGTLVNGVLDYAWIYGKWGFPASGIAGAGWATVVGSWASALLGLGLLLLPRFRTTYATLSGWRFEWKLFKRLLFFGVPSGLQWSLDALAFTVFLVLVGQLGEAPLAASSVAVTINMVGLVPMLGLAQAVAVLVGQRLGQDRPDLAERSTWRGAAMCLAYTGAAAAIYAFWPNLLLPIFQDQDATRWAAVTSIVPTLLKFVAVYCMFDGTTLVLSSALRGAGDTRFVSLALLAAAWSLMVIPTIIARKAGAGLFTFWGFATGYLVVLAFVFVWRFRQGKWRKMRVIEPAPLDVDDPPTPITANFDCVVPVANQGASLERPGASGGVP